MIQRAKCVALRNGPMRCVGVIAVLLIAAGCSRVGFDSGPGGPGAEGPPQPIVQSPVVPDRVGAPVGPTRILDHPPLAVDEVDPILNSVVRDDPLLNERIDYWIQFWTTRGAGHFGRYIERMARYHGVVDRELEDRGLPPSLRFLPVVESGYHHGAVSRVGATGMWQIMTPTARDLGLSVSSLVDDRRDPLLSTRAALDYLQQLYLTFDSWFLALAAYNAGPGRVGNILRQHAPDDDTISGDELYLMLRARFPAETREFVPRFFAAAAIAGDPERYGFDLPVGIAQMAFDEVLVPDATSFDVLARAAGVDEAEIRALNPHFLRGFTPAGEARAIRLPPGRGADFEVNYAMIPPEERISFLEHVVASGETLTHIARRYSVSVNDLSAANGSVDPRRLQVGRRLVVPVAGARPTGATAMAAVTAGADDDSAESANAASSESESSFRHEVRSGESLWILARRYSVSVADLRRWNDLSANAVLQPGMRLIVGVGISGNPRSYEVRPGDTWGGIAERFGVRTSELASANGRTTRDVIRVGEEIQIP